jgi:hypothetical protein
MMQPSTGKLYYVESEDNARKRGLIPVRRDLTARERYEQQIRLYSPCACGSGKKLKFCCYRKEPKGK